MTDTINVKPPQEVTVRRVSNGFIIQTGGDPSYTGRGRDIIAVAETPESLVAQVKKWAKEVTGA